MCGGRQRQQEERETQPSHLKCMCAVRDGLQNTVLLCYVEGGRSNGRRGETQMCVCEACWPAEHSVLCYVQEVRPERVCTVWDGHDRIGVPDCKHSPS